MDDGELERERLAVEQTPAEIRAGAERMRDLGALWRRRFLAAGDITELDRAIGYFRGALGSAGTALPAAGVQPGRAALRQYDVLGDAADLAAAIGAVQRGLVPCQPARGDRHDYLAMLAVCLWERYDATGSLSDLSGPSSVAAEAVAGTAPDAPLGPRLNSNLGMMYLDRHERDRRRRRPGPGDRARGTRR